MLQQISTSTKNWHLVTFTNPEFSLSVIAIMNNISHDFFKMILYWFQIWTAVFLIQDQLFLSVQLLLEHLILN